MHIRLLLLLLIATPLTSLSATQLLSDEFVMRSIRLGAGGPPAGEPDSVTVVRDRGAGTEYDVFHYPGLRVEVVGETIGEITCWAEPCGTPRGIGLGDTLEAVRAAYDTDEDLFFDSVTQETWLLLLADDAEDWALGFRFENDRVVAIQLGCLPCY